MSARLAQAEADAAAAREAAAVAHLAASKAEADLADLSGAYNNLEAHAFATEAQLRSAQGALAAAQQAAAAAEARAQAAEAGALPSFDARIIILKSNPTGQRAGRGRYHIGGDRTPDSAVRWPVGLGWRCWSWAAFA
jgi:hypothetical protein